jgi:hypothetical protein
MATMTDTRLAVLFLHGIEIYDDKIVDVPRKLLSEAFEKHSGQPWANGMVMEAALWGEEMGRRQEELFRRSLGSGAAAYSRRMTQLTTEVNAGSQLVIPELLLRSSSRLPKMKDLYYPGLRWFLLNFVGDAIAYQKVGGDNELYNRVHAEVGAKLGELAEQAGPDAPLCVIGHSLGSVIASNYLYDLQQGTNDFGGDTPLERGETLAFLYTLGSPIALWASSYLTDKNFGQPITVPAKKFGHDDPDLGWVNLIDADDVFAWPLRPLGDAYQQVTDRYVSVGPLPINLTPLSHISYWYDSSVMAGIGETLARWWWRTR